MFKQAMFFYSKLRGGRNLEEGTSPSSLSLLNFFLTFESKQGEDRRTAYHRSITHNEHSPGVARPPC
jgi:hypothetical protein